MSVEEKKSKPCTECRVIFFKSPFESTAHFERRKTCGKYSCVQECKRKRQHAGNLARKERQLRIEAYQALQQGANRE